MRQAGTSIGRYTLVEPLGEGGFGSVWRAETPAREQVAIKFLHRAGSDARVRFEREVRALMRVDHPACVRPIDFGTTSTDPYLVTDLVKGVPFSDWVKSTPPMSERLGVLAEIADALVAAHRVGVVHRDVKPSNLLIVGTRPPRPAVLDFGLAKLSGTEYTDVTKTGDVLGTPGYMSPEQLHGVREVGPKTDVYALGVVAFITLEGRPPFAAASALELAMKHLQDAPPPLTAEVPERLRRLVANMLSKSEADRPSASEVAATLHGQHFEQPAGTLNEALGSSRAPLGVGIAIAILCLVAALALVFGSEDEKPPPPPPVASVHDRDPVESPRPMVELPDSGDQDSSSPARSGRCAEFVDKQPGLRNWGSADAPVWVRIPRGYAESDGFPLLLFFHDGFHGGASLLDPLEPIADDYVIIAPEHPPATGFWWRESYSEVGIARAVAMLNDLCLDDGPVFVLGHGSGGRAALAYGCVHHDTVVATFAARVGPRECVKPPRAMLQIFVRDDPFAPWLGGETCNDSNENSVADQVGRIGKLGKCSDVVDLSENGCLNRTCERPQRICIASGGRQWPGVEPALTGTGQAALQLFPKCIAKPADHDVIAEIRSFFASFQGRDDVSSDDGVDLGR